MFGKIKYITEGEAHVESKIEPGQDVDLMNSNVVFEAPNQEILGEVEEVNDDTIKIRFLGEFINGKYVSGVIRKPLLSSNIRMINKEELQELDEEEADPDDDQQDTYFKVEEIEGTEFGASKPWIGELQASSPKTKIDKNSGKPPSENIKKLHMKKFLIIVLEIVMILMEI